MDIYYRGKCNDMFLYYSIAFVISIGEIYDYAFLLSLIGCKGSFCLVHIAS